MHDLTTTQGIVALAAAAGALLALALIAWLALRLRRLTAGQRVVLGQYGTRDLTGHAEDIDREFRALHAYVEDVAARLHERMDVVEQHLDGAIAYCALVRYDAYNEMSGHQSTSIALLDATRSGVVLTSIHHRDQARLYVKRVLGGRGELELSPEEDEAVTRALSGGEPAAA